MTMDNPTLTIVAPVGRWWLAYDDCAVWPCQVDAIAPFNQVRVTPVHPAPDAGKSRLEPRGRVYDSAFNHPTQENT